MTEDEVMGGAYTLGLLSSIRDRPGLPEFTRLYLADRCVELEQALDDHLRELRQAVAVADRLRALGSLN